jgi:CBS domain-containing protein
MTAADQKTSGGRPKGDDCMKVKDIMTSRVITLSPDMAIVDAAKILMDNNINGAPVLDKQGVLVGILCRDDLISQQKKLPLPSYFIMLDGVIPLISPKHLEKEMAKITATNVEHAMTAKPVTVSPDADIDVVAGLMVDKKIHTIPVIDSKGGLVGIVGKEDILRTLIAKN